MKWWPVVLALAASACGGESPETETRAPQNTPAPAAAPSPEAAGETPAPPARRGTSYEVRMVETEDGRLQFEPAALTIRRGDRVRWINVSGGPHNVRFSPDGIPPGAAAVLGTAMRDTFAPLTGPLLVQPNATYEISFAGAPAGRYEYTCTPHEMLGMDATLTVIE